METLEGAEAVLKNMEEAMKERVGALAREYSILRTGRANPMILESVKVSYYGQDVPLKQVAAISVPEGRVLEIRPWDPSVLADIEKALQKTDVGAMPQNDGKLIRLMLPAMTEERRKEMAKVVKRMAEEFRVALRNERHEALEKIKKSHKTKELSDDDLHGLEARVQKVTDVYIKQVDAQSVQKEKEIATI